MCEWDFSFFRRECILFSPPVKTEGTINLKKDGRCSMKRTLFTLSAAALLLFTLAACGTGKTSGGTDDARQPNSSLEDALTPDGSSHDEDPEKNNARRVEKEDCSSVYAEVISVNGGNLTVSAGDKVLSLTVETGLLVDWKEGDEVILYYTGAFGDGMEVHYIDKWTENSEVQRPENKDRTAREETGGSVVS